MPSRLSVLLLLSVLGSFVAAVLIGISAPSSSGVEGALLLFAGVSAVVFARRLTEAQKDLAERGFVPKNWANSHPLLFILWGMGVGSIGAMQLFGW